MLTENIAINFTPGGVPVVLKVSQYDVGSRTFVFTPYTSEGTWTAPAAGTATLEATKPDGNALSHTCTYDATDGTITYTLQDQLAAVAGRVWSKLVLRDLSSNIIGSQAVIWLVDMAGIMDSAVVSDSDLQSLQEFLQEFSSIQQYASALAYNTAEIAALRAAVGTPLTAATAAAMTDTSKIYVYTGSESGYTNGNWYYYDGSAWTSGGVYNAVAVQLDDTLTVQGVAADAKAVGDELDDLKSAINNLAPAYDSTETYAVGDYVIYNYQLYRCTSTISTAEAWTAAHWIQVTMLDDLALQSRLISNEIKIALLELFEHVAYIDDDGQDYYDALESALYLGAELSYITAVYTQGSDTIYTDDDIDDLKDDLVVTAHYSDGTTAVVTAYTLSGTLAEGTSTVTATYRNKSTTFNVTVVDFYNIWSWSNSSPFVISLPYGTSSYTVTDGYIPELNNASSNNTRCSFWVTKGKESTGVYSQSSGTVLTDTFLIPVPKTATSVAATLVDSGQYLAIMLYKYIGNGVWNRYSSTGWQLETATTSFTAEEDMYITINCKASNGGSDAFDGSTYPWPTINIVFS